MNLQTNLRIVRHTDSLRYRIALLAFTVLLSFAPRGLGQTAFLRGQVTDESGAVIPGAKITLTAPSGLIKTATANNNGSYSIGGVPAGSYSVEASAPELALPQPMKITLRGGAQRLDLQLSVAATMQQVTVQENGGPAVSTDPASNAGALALRGNDLQALADNPEDLEADLQALAGPSAGPSGGAIFIDGFSGGQLPPKESIREIRINQNPFSPEYDTLGYGRIEILTKPGTDKFHGMASYNFGDSFWNSRNPYAAEKAPFVLHEFGGNLAGAIGKRTSFTVDIQRHAIDNGAIINGSTLDDATLAVVNPFTQVFPIPQRRLIITPRIDYQLNPKNTLTVRYHGARSRIASAGVGGFNLVSQKFDAHSNADVVQLTETAVLGASVINEARFQYFRATSSMTAANPGPTIRVLGSFNGGGAAVNRSSDQQNHYELQNYVSVARQAHSWKLGVRLRGDTDDNTSRQNFDGTFTFGGGLAPQLDASNRVVLDASSQPVLVNIDSIERYRRTLTFARLGFPAGQIRSLGGGATQFSISAGLPLVSAARFDLGVFAGDDWRVRPDLTLSLGVRYETQTNIHDWRDFAPRIGLAWAVGGGAGKSRPKNVLRAGFGMFYDRFSLANTITALRYDGLVQQQYLVTDPDFFPVVPSLPSLTASQPSSTVQQVSSTLRAPYMLQSALAFERQLPRDTTIAITYASSHGVHLLRSENINAPLPGTFNSGIPNSGLFPYVKTGPIFLMESAGIYNQNQMIANINSKLNGDISLFGSYVLNRAMSDTDGLNTFPAKPYSSAGEYGAAETDVRHRVSLGGTINTKWGVRFSPLLNVSSGPPFDITVGHDQYGDTLFNSRPSIAADAKKPGAIATAYGLLDPNPGPNDPTLSRNFGRGPGMIMLNLNVRKTFGFGRAREGSAANASGPSGGNRNGPSSPFSVGGGPGGPASSNRRYNLSVAMSVRNILNHNNPGPIVGNIASPLFGQANQPFGVGVLGGTGFSESANNRRLELQTRFTF